MVLYKKELIAVILLLSLMIFLSSYSDFVSSGRAISRLPSWAQSWAGVPWDVTNPSDVLVSADYRNGKVKIDAKGDYIWHAGWIWNPSKINVDGSKGGWEGFEFPQNSQYPGWSQDEVSAEISVPSDELLDGDNYVLAYTCQWKDERWYCGCLNENTCNRWQLQSFEVEGFDDAILGYMEKYIRNPGEVPDFPEMAAKIAVPDNGITTEPRADFNEDGTVNFGDFFLFADAFGTTNSKFDLSGNRMVDFDDFFIFADEFGKKTSQTLSERKIIAGLNSEFFPLNENDYKKYENNILIDYQIKNNNNNLYSIEFLLDYDIDKSEIGVKLIRFDTHEEYDLLKYATYIKNTKIFKDYSVSKYGLQEAKIYSLVLDANELDKGLYVIYFLSDIVSPISPVIAVDDISKYNIGNSCTIMDRKGDAKNNIDIIFVPDKYEKTEEGHYKFARDVDDTIKNMLNDITMDKYKERMNIYRVDNFDFPTNCNPGKCVPNILEPFTDHLGLICCSTDAVKNAAKLCNTDNNIINVLTNQEPSETFLGIGFSARGNVIPDINPERIPGLNIIYAILIGIDSSGITITTTEGIPETPLHEVGHLVASLPDYYRPDAACVEHPCKMCRSSEFDFSDEKKCYDKQAMVEYLNQWCKAKKLEIIRRSPTSPYPNPFDPSEGQVTNVKFSLEYEAGETPCFALMKVYNSIGQVVDLVVSKEPASNGEHILQWDGKNLDVDTVASGVYTYEVSIGSKKDSVKGTVIK